MSRKKYIKGSMDIKLNKIIIFISSIDEKLTKGFVDVLKNKITNSTILLQSKNKKNITKKISDNFKKYNVILLCGSNMSEFIDIVPLCHIHVCPIPCENYIDIKRNKNILLSRTVDDGNTWDNYWKNLVLLKIDEITHPVNYNKTHDNILELLKLQL